MDSLRFSASCPIILTTSLCFEVNRDVGCPLTMRPILAIGSPLVCISRKKTCHKAPGARAIRSDRFSDRGASSRTA
jgi:hypothetical protein